MVIHVIVCPNCNQADCIERGAEFEFNKKFECECGEEFDLGNAKIIELEKR